MSPPSDTAMSPFEIPAIGAGSVRKKEKRGRPKEQMIDIEHIGVNERRPASQGGGTLPPIELDFAGTSYVFHPLGERYERGKAQVRLDVTRLDGERAQVKGQVPHWNLVKKKAGDPGEPMKPGENVVTVPMRAWNKWLSTAGDVAKMTVDGKRVLVTSTEKILASSHKLADQRAETESLLETNRRLRAENEALAAANAAGRVAKPSSTA